MPASGRAEAAEWVEVTSRDFSLQRGALEVAGVDAQVVAALVNHTGVIAEEADEVVAGEGEVAVETGHITPVIVVIGRLTQAAFERAILDRTQLVVSGGRRIAVRIQERIVWARI